MAKRKHASADPRGGEGAGGAAVAQSVGGGGTSTDQPSAQTFSGGAYENFFDPTLLPTYAYKLAAPPAKAQQRPTNQSFSPTPPNGSYPITTRPTVALATAEQQEAFAQAVVDHEGIIPAARAWGLGSSAVFFHMGKHPDFGKLVYAAQAANFETQVYKLDELCNNLLKKPPKEMNQCANAYGRVFDYRMRIVGKLLPKMYGDAPGAQVNIQNNTGIVCNEETRARLIDLNQKLLTASQPKELEQ